MNGKTIGDIGEATVLLNFLKYNAEVFLPYGENTKIDLLAYFNNKINKIQVKTTSNLVGNNSYKVRLRNSSLRSDGHVVYTGYEENEVDYFAIYCLQRPEPILIPYELVKNKTDIRICFDNVENSSKSFIEDNYLFSTVFTGQSVYQEIKQKDEKKKHYCKDCGIEIAQGSIRCRKCAINKRIKTKNIQLEKTISREDLKNKIRTQSFLSIGKEFDVSDNAIRKWCQKYDLPNTKKDILSYSDEEWEQI